MKILFDRSSKSEEIIQSLLNKSLKPKVLNKFFFKPNIRRIAFEGIDQVFDVVIDSSIDLNNKEVSFYKTQPSPIYKGLIELHGNVRSNIKAINKLNTFDPSSVFIATEAELSLIK